MNLNLDQFEMVLAVAIITLSIVSLVSSMRQDLKDVGRLRFRWVYLLILGLIFISINTIFRITKVHWGIRIILTTIGVTCVGGTVCSVQESKPAAGVKLVSYAIQ